MKGAAATGSLGLLAASSRVADEIGLGGVLYEREEVLKGRRAVLQLSRGRNRARDAMTERIVG